MNKKILTLSMSLLLLLTAAIWGFAFVVVKDSLSYVGAVWMLCYRFSIAAVFLSLIYIKKFKAINKKVLLEGVILGTLLFAAYFTQTIGCKWTTAGKNAFLTTIYVFLVPIFTALFTRRRPPLYVFFCALLSMVGIALLSLNNSKDAGGINKGDVLTLICGVFFALHISTGSLFTRQDDPLLLSILQFIVAAVLGTILAPIVDGVGSNLASFTTFRVLIPMLYLGIFSTMAGFVLQNVGLKYLPSSYASLLLSFESVFGALFGVLFLQEPFTLRIASGSSLLFLAVILAQVIPSIQEKNAPLK